jgi:hypothetical protein
MLRTYKAVLSGNQVEWIDPPPQPVRPTPVHITLLEDEVVDPGRRGREMAAALESIAAAGRLSSIDAMAWERELRQDRSLPGRED